MTQNFLAQCAAADLLTCDLSSLARLDETPIDAALPVPRRMEDFASRLGNPYLFRLEGMAVKVHFSGQQSIYDALSRAMGIPNSDRF